MKALLNHPRPTKDPLATVVQTTRMVSSETMGIMPRLREPAEPGFSVSMEMAQEYSPVRFPQAHKLITFRPAADGAAEEDRVAQAAYLLGEVKADEADPARSATVLRIPEAGAEVEGEEREASEGPAAMEGREQMVVRVALST